MSLAVAICCPSTGGHDAAIDSWMATASIIETRLGITVMTTTGGEGAGYLQKVQQFYEANVVDVLGYLHSDLIIHEQGWDQRVLTEFEDPSIAIVSFGGSKHHGTKDIYKVPYDFRQLGRSAFLSNLTDAHLHGAVETSARDVAVIDSFALFIRRDVLSRFGGWPVATYPPSHASDYWACLMAHRLGYRVRMVGVNCTHKSGGVGLGGWDYPSWISATKWKSDENCHRIGHELIYDEFRDVLPVEVP